MNVKNKVAIVTGASLGIGEATAKLLASKGTKVVLAARSKNKLEKLAGNLKDSLAVECDVTKESDLKNLVEQTLKRFGQIDILVNNAGRGYDASVEKTKIDVLRQIYNLDVIAPLIATQMVIPHMRKQGAGAIVNISSGTALMYLPNMAAYSSAKRALVQISLTAREELKTDNITVSVVFPFITDTDFEKNTIKGETVEVDWQGSGREIPPADSADFAAAKVLEAIETGKAEIYAHDWMKNR